MSSKIKIYFRAVGGAAEVIDRAGSSVEAKALFRLYQLTYRNTPGRLWVGEEKDEHHEHLLEM